MATGCYDIKTGRQISSHTDDRVFANLFHAYGDRTQPVCFNQRMQAIYIMLLLALQVLTIVWFRMICCVAYRVLTGKGAEDSRSDDEDEADEDEVDHPQVLDEKTGIDAARMNGNVSPQRKQSKNGKSGRRNHSGRKTPGSTTPPKMSADQSRTSAVGLPGHMLDDKQLS